MPDDVMVCPMASYWIAATNISNTRFAEMAAVGETDALSKACSLSAETPNDTPGVFEVSPSDGAVLVASFFNGKRRFTARAEADDASDVMVCPYPSRADLEAAVAELEQQLSDEKEAA